MDEKNNMTLQTLIIMIMNNPLSIKNKVWIKQMIHTKKMGIQTMNNKWFTLNYNAGTMIFKPLWKHLRRGSITFPRPQCDGFRPDENLNFFSNSFKQFCRLWLKCDIYIYMYIALLYYICVINSLVNPWMSRYQ